MTKRYDLIVVGGGVIGCAVAWYFSHYDLDIAVLEKERDVCCGVSKANTGIFHSRSYWTPKTLKGELHLRSLPWLPRVQKELDLPVRKCGALTVALSPSDIGHLREVKTRGQCQEAAILGASEARNIEPNLNKEVKAAYYDPRTWVVSPFQLVHSLAECAVLNGVDFYFGEHVQGFEKLPDKLRLLAQERQWEASYAVTAAGLSSAEVAGLSYDTIPEVRPCRGEYFVLDRDCDGFVGRVLYPAPGERSKGILVCPTPEGNVLAGPNFEPLDCVHSSTTPSGLAEVERGAQRLTPAIPLEKNIRNFSGLRPTLPGRDFCVFFSRLYSRLIHLVGIESPGLTAAFGIADYVGEQLKKKGLPLREKKNFRYRESFPVFREADWITREKLIADDPDWGEVICRCEEVTVAEVKHALRTSPGANTLDGLKRRIRITAGRCQGSFCLMNVPRLMADLGNIPYQKIYHEGPDSPLFLGETKEEALRS